MVGEPAQAQAQYAQAWGDAESQAYYAALKTRMKVEIKPISALAAAPAPPPASAVTK